MNIEQYDFYFPDGVKSKRATQVTVMCSICNKVRVWTINDEARRRGVTIICDSCGSDVRISKEQLQEVEIDVC